MIKWIKQYKFFLLALVVIAAVLTAAFVAGGRLSDDTLPAQPSVAASAGNTTEATAGTSFQATTKETKTTTLPTAGQPAATTSLSEPGASLAATNVPATRAHAAAPEQTLSSAPVQANPSAALTQPAPRANASESRSAVSTTAKSTKPTELQPTKPQEQTCTFSISCAVLLHQRDTLEEAVAELVPKDGYLLQPVKMSFSTGESVFDLLKRVCKQNGIHMEYTDTPAYHSAYIEGIGNLYEFDCGEGSGWMYQVNGQYPNYGCSRCTVKNGDIIEWRYTCDYGKDIGGNKFQNTD